MKTLKFTIIAACLLLASACQEEEVFPSGNHSGRGPEITKEGRNIPQKEQLVPISHENRLYLPDAENYTFSVTMHQYSSGKQLHIWIEKPSYQVTNSSYFVIIDEERMPVKKVTNNKIVVDLPGTINSGVHEIIILSSEYELLGSGHFRL